MVVDPEGQLMLFDLDALPARERYKLVTSTIVPRPIAWVVTTDEQGRLNAAPYSFFNVFSDDPVVVAISVGMRPQGGMKDTAASILACGQFVVCLVSEAMAEQMNVTAASFDAGVDELIKAGLTTLPSTKVAPPRIAESPVALECEIFQTIPIGHHTLILGKGLALHVRDDCVRDPARNYIGTARLELIGRMHAPSWYTRTYDCFELPRVTPAEWEARSVQGSAKVLDK
jgi:flavin reductase (DIM6/NTAB) family NADH-FMN oxidoreductase RutF